MRLSAVTALTRSCAVLTYRDTDGPEGPEHHNWRPLSWGLHKEVCVQSQKWWCTPIIPALVRQRQEDIELEAGLCCIHGENLPQKKTKVRLDRWHWLLFPGTMVWFPAAHNRLQLQFQEIQWQASVAQTYSRQNTQMPKIK